MHANMAEHDTVAQKSFHTNQNVTLKCFKIIHSIFALL